MKKLFVYIYFIDFCYVYSFELFELETIATRLYSCLDLLEILLPIFLLKLRVQAPRNSCPDSLYNLYHGTLKVYQSSSPHPLEEEEEAVALVEISWSSFKESLSPGPGVDGLLLEDKLKKK